MMILAAFEGISCDDGQERPCLQSATYTHDVELGFFIVMYCTAYITVRGGDTNLDAKFKDSPPDLAK